MSYQTIPYPLTRRLVEDAGRLGNRTRMIHGLFEVDVTDTRRQLRDYRRRSDRPLSLTSYLIYCFAHSLEQQLQLNAYRQWRNKVVVFNDVDVMAIVEIEIDDNSFPLAHIIKSANRKSMDEIQDEISRVQQQPATPSSWRWMVWFLRLPAAIRYLMYLLVSKYPPFFNRYVGTVGITSVGMFGPGGGWGIPLSIYTLNLTVGGLSKKPGVVNNQVCVREYLSVTISANHDLVDGAPLARFVSAFKKSVERGRGFSDSSVAEH